jgi:hypothetical protein
LRRRTKSCALPLRAIHQRKDVLLFRGIL